MPHDNVIDFGSLKGHKSRPKVQKSERIEDDAAFQAELASMMGKIPAHMQEYVGRRFSFLMMYSVVTARVAEMLTELDYDPENFEPEEESTEAFLANGPFFIEDDDKAPLWNGPMFDAVEDEIFYRVASNITLDGEDNMEILHDLLKREEDGGKWQILVDGEWQPGPPDEYFGYLSMMRDDWEDEEEPETIYDLNLSSSIICALDDAGIETISDLCGKTTEELLSIKGIGRKSIQAIRDELIYYGLRLSDD